MLTLLIALIVVVVVVLVIRALLPYLGLPDGVNQAILLVVGLAAFLWLLSTAGIWSPSAWGLR